MGKTTSLNCCRISAINSITIPLATVPVGSVCCQAATPLVKVCCVPGKEWYHIDILWHLTYCWWKKSCTSWCGYLINLSSFTVVQDFFPSTASRHQPLQSPHPTRAGLSDGCWKDVHLKSSRSCSVQLSWQSTTSSVSRFLGTSFHQFINGSILGNPGERQVVNRLDSLELPTPISSQALSNANNLATESGNREVLTWLLQVPPRHGVIVEIAGLFQEGLVRCCVANWCHF